MKSSTGEAQSLLSHFLTAPEGNTPSAIKERIIHWEDVYLNPAKFTDGNGNRYAIAARKKTARQNLRKLILKHPNVAAALKRERESQGAA